MDIEALKTLKLHEFEDQATGYRSVSDMASQAKDALEQRITIQMRKALKGEAVDAAVVQLRAVAENFHYVQVECGLVATALNAFAADMRPAQDKLKRALSEAAEHTFTVGADGSVAYPAAGENPGGSPPQPGSASGTLSEQVRAIQRQAGNFDPNPNYAIAQGIANRIAEALKEATDADQKWAPQLRKLKADDDLVVSAEDWADAGKDTEGVRRVGRDYLDSMPQPPKDGSPKANADWWKGLDPEQQAAWTALQPNTVGGLDGLPATARDEANRIVLDEKRGQYRTELNGIPKPPANEWTWITAGMFPSKVHTDEWMEWDKKYGDQYRHLKSSLNGMNAIQTRFDQTGVGGLPEAYLLGFSPEGNGRAIVANGNPDTARHQAVYVPGTTSNLGSIGGNVDRMTELWRQTQQATPNASVSTITWLGYDAPQSIVKDAPFEHYAYDGAPAYRKFLDGLDASYSGSSEPHRTAIGHSYGTTLIGAAAQTGDLNADDVIFAGSPGVKVGSADEMDVPKGHVWNEEADGDKVPDIGRWGHGGSQWKMGGGVFLIPSDDAFGAHQMNTHAEGSGPQATTGAEGHSEYWEKGTTALKNQALVVVGEYGDVTAPR
ncbi:alpha/beta hydrolase [Streptomyces hygroscopicus]|uniref:alpha/beta hydrolase n=1 Tax=Streptomyces hygroscopicus TaxID=1912 RepID=UPI0007DAEB15|nr:alpha/beta hydrolase [Streptomyces sp. NBRC 109436]